MASIFDRIRNFFRGGSEENQIPPLPTEVQNTIVQNNNVSSNLKLKDVDMPEPVKRLYNDIFMHIWNDLGFKDLGYDNYMQVLRLNPNNKNLKSFNEYLDRVFDDTNSHRPRRGDALFRIKLNRLNSLLGSEYSIKSANDLITFITENRYPKSLDNVSEQTFASDRRRPRPRASSEFKSDVPEYLRRDRVKKDRRGFEPDRPSFMKEKQESSQEFDLNKTLKDVQSEVRAMSKSGELGPATIDDYLRQIKSYEERTNLTDRDKETYYFLLRRCSSKMLGRYNELIEKKDLTDEERDYIQKYEDISNKVLHKFAEDLSDDDLRREIDTRTKNSSDGNRSLKNELNVLRDELNKRNKRKVDDMLQQTKREVSEMSGKLGPANIEDYNNAIKAFEIKSVLTSEERRIYDNLIQKRDALIRKEEAEKSKEVSSPSKTKRNYNTRNLQEGEEVLDIDPSKKALLDYSNMKKISEKIENIRLRASKYRENGNIDLAEECEVLLEDLEHFKNEVASIKREKQRAYRNISKNVNEKIKTKNKARLDSLAIRQKRLEDDKRALIEMEQILDSEIMKSEGKSK